MNYRGKMKYIPKDFLDELENIKFEKQIKDSDAFRELKSYSEIGREVERLMKFGLFGKQKRK